MRDQIDFHKARHRLRPVGKHLDRDLVLEQRAGSGGLMPRLGSPAREEASARSMVAGLIRATRSIVSAETCRKACQWRNRSRSSGRKGARRFEQMPSVADQHTRSRATSAGP
jgi:hypothetical protein